MPLQDIPLPFGEWLPDLGENNNPGLVEAKNVIARPEGYAPIGGYASMGVTLTRKVAKAKFFRANDNNLPYLMLAEENRIAVLQLTNTLATQATANLSVNFGASYRFSQFDNNIYCTREDVNFAIPMYKYNTSGGTFSTPVSLSALNGAQIGRFLLLARCGATGLTDQFSFRWSAFNNPDDFSISQTTQAGAATVNTPSLGPITGIVGGRQSLLFQKYGISRIAYVGPPLVWGVDVIDGERGCIAPDSIVTIGDLHYFISHQGICVANGAQVSIISDGRVTEWLFANAQPQLIQSAQSAHIESIKSIVWAIPARSPTSFSASVFDKILVYSYETNSFSYLSVDGVDSISAGAITLGSGASLLNSEFAKSVVVAVYRNGVSGGSPVASTAHTLTGDNLAAELTTGYTTLTPGKRTSVNAVEPVYDGSGAKVAINTKATQAGAASAGAPVAVNSLGIANVRADGRLAAVSVTFDAAAEWSELKGAVVTADTSGAR